MTVAAWIYQGGDEARGRHGSALFADLKSAFNLALSAGLKNSDNFIFLEGGRLNNRHLDWEQLAPFFPGLD
jgi:hypothetical protein